MNRESCRKNNIPGACRSGNVAGMKTVSRLIVLKKGEGWRRPEYSIHHAAAGKYQVQAQVVQVRVRSCRACSGLLNTGLAATERLPTSFRATRADRARFRSHDLPDGSTDGRHSARARFSGVSVESALERPDRRGDRHGIQGRQSCLSNRHKLWGDAHSLRRVKPVPRIDDRVSFFRRIGLYARAGIVRCRL